MSVSCTVSEIYRLVDCNLPYMYLACALGWLHSHCTMEPQY